MLATPPVIGVLTNVALTFANDVVIGANSSHFG